MGAVYSEILRASEAQGFAPPRQPRVAAQVAGCCRWCCAKDFFVTTL